MKQASGVEIPHVHPRSWAADLVDGTLVLQSHIFMILCGAWAVWTEHNAIWHGEGGRTATQSYDGPVRSLLIYVKRGKTRGQNIAKFRCPRKLQKFSGVVKVNTDAGVQQD
jgi:hypothetical protein